MKFKISIQLGRGAEICEKPTSLLRIEISRHWQFKYKATYKNKEKRLYFKYISAFSVYKCD